MTSFLSVVGLLIVFGLIVAVRAKRRDDEHEFRGPGPIDAMIALENARREQEGEA